MIRIELVVSNIENNYYALFDENKNEYRLFMLFQAKVRVGDKILINKKLLKSNSLYFGNLDEISGRNIKSMDDEDLIIIKSDKEIYQKRLYG